MKINKIPLFSIVFLLLVSGCSHNIDSMIENYNSKIPAVDNSVLAEDSPGPGEPGFDESEMLADFYTFDPDGTVETFQLQAPKKCRSIKWKVEEYDSTRREYFPVEVDFLAGSSDESVYFAVPIPKHGLEPGHSYWITLIVTSKEDVSYKDKTVLHVHPVVGPGA